MIWDKMPSSVFEWHVMLAECIQTVGRVVKEQEGLGYIGGLKSKRGRSTYRTLAAV